MGMREEYGGVCQGCGDIGRNRTELEDGMPEIWSCTRCGRVVTAQGETAEEFRKRLNTIKWKEHSSYMIKQGKTADELAEMLKEVLTERDALLDCLRLSQNNCDYCRNRTIPQRERGCDYDCDDCQNPCPCRDCTAEGEHFEWIGAKESQREDT